MLAGRSILQPEFGSPVRVDFQVASDGWRLDDVLVEFATRSNRVRWALSVKSSAYIGATAPKQLVKDLWSEVLGHTSSGFAVGVDFLGIVTAPLGSEATS